MVDGLDVPLAWRRPICYALQPHNAIPIQTPDAWKSWNLREMVWKNEMGYVSNLLVLLPHHGSSSWFIIIFLWKNTVVLGISPFSDTQISSS